MSPKGIRAGGHELICLPFDLTGGSDGGTEHEIELLGLGDLVLGVGVDNLEPSDELPELLAVVVVDLGKETL